MRHMQRPWNLGRAGEQESWPAGGHGTGAPCLFDGLGVFSSQISVFPSRGVSFSQIVFFGSRGVSGSQVLVFPVPGLVFFLPAFCVGFFGSHSWCFPFPEFSPPGLCVFSSWIGVFLAQLLCWCFWFPGLGVFSPGQCVPCPAPVLVCPFTCLFVSFRLNFWLPLPTAGFESTYSCHTIKQTKNTAKPSKPFAVKTCQFA